MCDLLIIMFTIKEVKFTNMASSGRDSMSDEIVNIKCCVCVEENRTREAEKYCCDCKDYYCSSCVGIHQKVPSMKGHKILNKADFKTLGPDGSLPSLPTQRCSLHIGEVINMYCEDHDEVACASCIALTHRSCKNAVSIPEDINTLYKKISLYDAKLKFSKTKQTMEAIKKTGETKLQELKGVLYQKIESVKAFRQELQALFDLMEQETIQELRREFTRIEACLERDINEAQGLVTSLQEATSQLKRSEGNMAQEFVCVKMSLKLLAKVKVDKNQPVATDETVSFTPDHSITTFLQQRTTLAETSINQSVNNVSVSKPEDQIFTRKDDLYRVKKQREIDVKLQTEKYTCNIWGSCVTEDGCLLLTDRWNKRLKCVDLSTDKVKSYIDLPTYPWDVCTVSKTEAAVTLGNKSVQFVSLGDNITATRTLTMKHCCCGIANKDGRLLISDNEKTVYIYDLNGQEQKRITKDSAGKDIFQYNQHIAVSASGDKMFVADNTMGVVVLDSQGNYLSTLSDNKVSDCEGVATDGRNVFVSGYQSDNIVQFGQDFRMLGEIGKVTAPHSMRFDQKKKQLIVTHCSNNITILELE